jgi:GT2 family glycosyltransferase
VSTDGFDQFQEQQDSGPVESDYITGCTLLVKKEVIEKIGLLNEDFFLYWEDVDWGIRAMKAGFKNLIVPSAHIWHKISVSAGGPDSPLKAYHKTRSHLYMAKLHTPYALTRLQRAFLRDISWLLLKSSDESRVKKAMAYLMAIMDYYRGRKDIGPHWLWRQA